LHSQLVVTVARMPGLTDDRITLAGLLFETNAALIRSTAPTLEASGLSPQWFEALLRLARTPGHRLRMSELASSMTSITPSGLTRLVDRLEDEGLVRREQCPSDRRGSFAALTDEGLERVERVLPGHLADLERCYIGLLSDREREQLEKILRRVRDANTP
jgi:MarR family 2-MHQ and catechol resistance regulon transcriptional repressor